MNSDIKQRLKQAYYGLFGHDEYQKFAIIAHARTGSNYLLAGLRSSEAIETHHEIFSSKQRTKGENFASIFSEVFGKKRKGTKAVGFKVFYYHLTDDEWTKLIAHKDLKVIHLTRENRLRTVVSQQIALKTDRWQSTNQTLPANEKKVRLDASTLVGQLRFIQNQEHLARERFKAHDILEVVYEDMVQNPGEVFQKLESFLGIDDIDVSQISLRKQNAEKLEELVVNYDEVVQALATTEFASSL
ncbi:MAG: Stf0 family sulfotransferase [Cyanobacteria bacterium P01_A01_bin.135]